MSVFLLAPNENWICDRFVQEWLAHEPFSTTQNISEASIVWLLADWCWNQIPRNILSSKKVVASVHHITPNKFNLKEQNDFADRDQYVDLYHVPCEKTKEQIKPYTSKPIWVQPFWVNPNLWFALDKNEILTYRTELGLNNSHFLVGSFQRDTEGHDLISPKLEKGPDLFCDAVEDLYKFYREKGREVRVLLAGWRRQYVMKRLDTAGIKYYYAELPPFELVNRFYNILDLYIVAARYEGGPQSIVECAVSKTPIVSTDVGLSTDFLSQESIFSPGDILNARPNINHAYEKVQDIIIPEGFSKFVKLFENLQADRIDPHKE